MATLLCAFLQTAPGVAQLPATVKEQGLTSDDLFDTSELHDIWIHINARDWEQLRVAYRENTYYPADVEWRGIKVRNAGIRVRGRNSRSGQKPGLRVDFNRYVTGQEFLGLGSLVLDNLWQDPSMIRERLAMLVFRRMGLPAPRESHARLYVGGDRQFVGVYGVVESIDKDFLKRNFGEDGGYLYEYRWQDEWGFQNVRSDLDWYAARFDPKTHEAESKATLFMPIRDLVDAINQAPTPGLEEALSPALNVGRYITHIAIENFLSQPDGLVGNLGMNNFYLYRYADKRLSQLIAWDQDLAFERLETPSPWHTIVPNVLATKIQSDPSLNAQYLRTLVHIAASLGGSAGTPAVTRRSSRACPAPDGEPPCGWLEEQIVRAYAQIREAALADPRTPYSNEQFEQAIEFLRRFARERGDIVRQDVARLAPDLVAGTSSLVTGSRTGITRP